jgi:DNA-binding transcriptional ArsR family regulator
LTGKRRLAYGELVADDPALFRALADSTRRLILDELVERDRMTLFELCARLAGRHGITSTRQAISQHLDVLTDAGLVRAERSGRYRFLHLDTTPLRQIADRWPDPVAGPAPEENP